MKPWIMFIIAYLIGSFFPLSRITGMFGGLGAKKSGGTATAAS